MKWIRLSVNTVDLILPGGLTLKLLYVKEVEQIKVTVIDFISVDGTCMSSSY